MKLGSPNILRAGTSYKKSTTQPWDPSFCSSGCPDSLLTLFYLFSQECEICSLWHHYFDTWDCWRKSMYRCWPISCICWRLFLDPALLPPSPHNALSRFVWRTCALGDTFRLSMLWQLLSLKLAGSKNHTGDRISTGKYPIFLGHCSCCHGIPGFLHHYVDYVGFCLIN